MIVVSASRFAFAALLAMVTFLTLTPDPDLAKEGFDLMRWLAVRLFGDASVNDKIAHFLAYVALGATAFLARLRMLGPAPLVVAALAAYGGLLEVLQGLGVARQADFFDAVANTAGAATGFALAAAVFGAWRARA